MLGQAGKAILSVIAMFRQPSCGPSLGYPLGWRETLDDPRRRPGDRPLLVDSENGQGGRDFRRTSLGDTHSLFCSAWVSPNTRSPARECNGDFSPIYN